MCRSFLLSGEREAAADRREEEEISGFVRGLGASAEQNSFPPPPACLCAEHDGISNPLFKRCVNRL